MSHKYGISVLLPTRGRTEALTRSVKSLVNRATQKDSIQILFGFDEDDAAGQENFVNELQPWLDEKGISYEAQVFEPMGYARLNEYVTALGLASDADWLFFWNDDALMESTGWDKKIMDHTGEFKLLAVHTHREHPYSIFPIVPTEWLDHLGYLSPHQANDAWLSQQAYLLDIWERIDVWVTHDRFDLTGNNKDATFEQREFHEGNPSNPKDFHNPAMQQLRMNDTGKLAQLMASKGLDTSWFQESLAGKRDAFEKMFANDINKQMARIVHKQ